MLEINDSPPYLTQPSIPQSPVPPLTDGSELIWAKDVPPPGEGEEIQSLWGNFLYPSSLHLMAGVAGIGKTTLLYNLAISLASGESFVGLGPPRPLRILYYDLETPELLFRRKLHLIANNAPPEGLAFARRFVPGEAMRLVKQHQFDLVFIDTLNEAFQTRDEMDNSEANREMTQLRNIIRETGVAIIAISHMGKDPAQRGVYRLRGASARPAAADIVLNLEPDREGILKLQVAKSRWVGNETELYLRKTGDDRFESVDSTGPSDGTMAEIQIFILGYLPTEPDTVGTGEVLISAKQRGYSQSTTERALGKLVDTGSVLRPKKGLYCRPRIHPSQVGSLDDGLMDAVQTQINASALA